MKWFENDTVESGYIIHGYIIQPFILTIFGRNRILHIKTLWIYHPHLFANTSDCVPFVQDGSNETDKFDVAEKLRSRTKLELLKHGKSQRSAAERLDIIGFGCFAHYGRHLEDELGTTGFHHPAAYISHFGPKIEISNLPYR